MIRILQLLIALLFFNTAAFAHEVIGFWDTIDEKTNKALSVVAIYEYQGKFFGRIVATYDEQGKIAETLHSPIKRAPGLKGKPHYAGLDLIWNLQKNGNRYENGTIVDPERGRLYGAKIWTQDGNLIVRGEFFFLGRNQTWTRFDERKFTPHFTKPEFSAFIPKIPEVK